jgi:cell division protein FtsL
MYKIIFKIGDSTYERKMNVKLNPKSTMTLEDCNKQFAAAKKCMKMHESLAILVDSVAVVEAKLKTGSVQKDIDAIASFKNTLLATKNSSIFADEKRLREEITELYSKICSQESSPGNLQIENLSKLEKELEKSKAKWLKIRKENNW